MAGHDPGISCCKSIAFSPSLEIFIGQSQGVIMPLPLLNVFKHSQFNWFGLHPPKTTGGEQFGFLHFCENVLSPPADLHIWKLAICLIELSTACLFVTSCISFVNTCNSIYQKLKTFPIVNICVLFEISGVKLMSEKQSS